MERRQNKKADLKRQKEERLEKADQKGGLEKADQKGKLENAEPKATVGWKRQLEEQVKNGVNGRQVQVV